jgi:hypothetical protein
MAISFKHGNKSLGYMKCGKFLDYSGGVSAYEAGFLLMETVTDLKLFSEVFGKY